MGNDKHIVVIIVGAIVTGFLFAMGADVVFAWFGKTLPPAVEDIMKVAFGSIATILAQTRGGQRAADGPPIPVDVTNTPANPVETHSVSAPQDGYPDDKLS